MKTLNLKVETSKFLKLFAFLFIFIIFNFKVLSLNLPKVGAQSALSFPIAELGSCRDAKECYLYCQIPENKAACWSYSTYVVGKNVLGVATASAEEQQQMALKAKQLGITFPIAELGNCTNPVECRTYCEQPTNQAACMSFAKKKGFAKEAKPPDDGIPQEKRLAIMQSAKSELGCTSIESCRSICEQNRDKCEAFAKKHGLTKEPSAEERQKKDELMRNAREEMGCTSMESCRSTCEKNPERCMQFAQKHRLDREKQPPELYQQSGSGSATRPPCSGEESCKGYCKEHPNECPGYQKKSDGMIIVNDPREAFGTPSSVFVGPAGCQTEAECKYFCQYHPEKCPGFPKPTPTTTPKQSECTGKNEGDQCSVMNCPPCPAGTICVMGCPSAQGYCSGGTCVIKATPKPAPPGCTYSRVQCFKEPCELILLCPTSASLPVTDTATTTKNTTTFPQTTP